MITRILTLLINQSVNPDLMKITLILLNITGIALVVSVIIKFVEHYFLKNKIVKQNGHLFSTFSMTALTLVIINCWFVNFGHFNIDKISQYIFWSIGAFMLLFGCFLHIWAKVCIKNFWSDGIEIKEEHKLINTGAYSIVRHPMYASLLLWCWGGSLMTFSMVGFFVTSFVFLPLMILRAKSEEKELLELVCDYVFYKKNVKMLAPTLKGKLAIFIRLIAVIIFGYYVFKGLTSSEIILLFFIQMYLGFSLIPEKVAFSYRSKSFILVFVFLISKFFYPIYYFYWVMILMFLYGLKWDCPCMIMYEKFGGCFFTKLLFKK